MKGGGAVRLAALLDRFVVQLVADGRSEHTIAQYRRHVGALGRWLAATGRSDALGRITHETIARFMAAPETRTRADGRRAKLANSLNATRTSLRCLFAFAQASGLAERNAAQLLRRARCAPPPPRAIAGDDVRRLLKTGAAAAATDERARRDHALFALLDAAGLRIGEALAREVGDVDLKGCTIRLRVTKGNRPAVIAIPAPARPVLRGLIGERAGGPLFVGRGGRAVGRRHVLRRLRGWLARAGVDGRATLHGFRHGFAQRLYDKTRDLLATADALRHASVTSTVVYSRIGPKTASEAVATRE